MTVRDCLQKVTYREYITWQQWLRNEWNEPSRTDAYLMKIAWEVRNVLNTKRSVLNLKDETIKFKFEEVHPTDTSPEHRNLLLRMAKAVWKSRVGFSRKQ